MPTYEYVCASCCHKLEAVQKISDSPLTLCPSCKRPSLQRGIGGGQLLLRSSKGEGVSQPASGGCCPCGKGKCGYTTRR